MAAEHWCIGRSAVHRPMARLVCLAHAGGSATQFLGWRVPPGVELVPVELPGHMARLGEAPYTCLNQCVEDMAQAVRPLLDTPYVLLGCSMGGLLAFELCRVLRRHGVPLPRALYVAAAPPPDSPRLQPPVHHLPDAAFILAMQQTYRGIPAAVAADPEMLQLLLPPLRCDMQMIETHAYKEEAPLPCPIQPLGGAADPTATAAHLTAWLRQSLQPRPPQMFPGGHFFLQGQADAILQLMANDLVGQFP